MKIKATLFTALSLLAFSTHAQAAVTDGTPISPATLEPLAVWVEQATNVHMQALPLAVASASKLRVAQNIGGVQNARAVAAYLPGRIVINNVVWDPESIRSQSYIVHELVHHAQLVSRRVYPCHAAKESEAYTLQNRWLAEHNQPPIVSAEWIAQIASCTGDDSDAD